MKLQEPILKRANALYKMDLTHDFCEVMSQAPCKLFIFGFKPSFEVTYSGRDKEAHAEILSGILKVVTNKDVFFGVNGNSLIFSYKKFDILGDGDLGLVLGFPPCCVKRYVIESNDYRSHNSAKRYLRQIDDMKLKDDPFSIFLCYRSASCSRYGFIPCSPDCKSALDYAKKLKEIEKKIRW